VLKVAGHRIGRADVEGCLVQHPAVAKAAVIGFPDEITGEAVTAFVTVKGGYESSDGVQKELIGFVGDHTGRFVRPKMLRFTPGLPKTRSGKIMRRLLRDIASSGNIKGDTTTLEDMSAIAALKGTEEED